LFWHSRAFDVPPTKILYFSFPYQESIDCSRESKSPADSFVSAKLRADAKSSVAAAVLSSFAKGEPLEIWLIKSSNRIPESFHHSLLA
jgi:hypothetical protein